MEARRRALILIALGGVVLLASGVALANPDPCLVVYPSGSCIYHYSPMEFYTVGPGDPRYDPQYDRGGLVLLTLGSNGIDLSIYQAPGLAGFVADSVDQGFYFEGQEYDLIIDGWSNTPITFVNILVVFDNPLPAGCNPEITVDGVPLVGSVYQAGDLVVQTPTPYGNAYSDVKVLHVTWTGCYGVHVWAFSDYNYDGRREGGECFTAYSHDLEVPIEPTTWGSVKAQYR